MWDDIVGQDKALGLLQSALNSGSAAHAYLFTGPRGVGRTMAAIRVAATLNCDNNGCGICASCVKTLKGAHPDVEIIEAADNVLKIEQIRNISRNIGLKPFEGRRKVYVIRNIETMNTESANALLKDLEEPPAYVMFILTAPGVDGLLPTIASRCQEVPFAGVPVKLLESILACEYGFPEEKAGVLAALSGGSFAKALKLADTGGAADLRDFILDNAGSLKDDDVLGVFGLKDEIMSMIKKRDKRESGQATAEVIDIIATWYRDMLVLKETGDETLLVNKDRVADIAALAGHYSRGRLTDALEILKSAAGAVRTNVNKELLLEHALLAISGS